MKNMLAVVCVLFCVFQGAKSAETESVVEDMSDMKQPSFGFERKLSAVAADELSTFLSSDKMANRRTCAIAERLEPGFARKGVAFRKTATPNAASCAIKCAKIVQGCVAINYKERDKTCYFLADPGYIHVSADYTTALVKPSVDVVCSSDNMILGYDRWGGDISTTPHILKNATECCSLCYHTPSCIAYVYYALESECWLKSTVPPLSKNDVDTTGLVCMS